MKIHESESKYAFRKRDKDFLEMIRWMEEDGLVISRNGILEITENGMDFLRTVNPNQETI